MSTLAIHGQLRNENQFTDQSRKAAYIKIKSRRLRGFFEVISRLCIVIVEEVNYTTSERLLS